MNGAILLIPAAMACSIAAFAPPAVGQTRGELLYDTNCYQFPETSDSLTSAPEQPVIPEIPARLATHHPAAAH